MPPQQPSSPPPQTVPDSNAPQPPRKSHKAVWVILGIVLGVGVIVAAIFVGMWAYEANQPKFNHYNSADHENGMSKSEKKNDEIDGQDVRFTDTGSTDKPLTWEFPANVNGWNTRALDAAGESQLIADNGCTFTSLTRAFNDGTGDDTSDSRSRAEAYVQRLNADLSLEQVEQVKSAVGTVSFIRFDSTYTSEQDQTYLSRFLVRVHNRRDNVLTIEYTCPQKDFSENTWNNLSGKVMVLGDVKG